MDGSDIGRALVTGGAGFVGHHLVDALDAVTDVCVLDDLSTGSLARVPDGVETHVGDVRDPDTLGAATADVDVIFHQAARISVERSIEEPIDTESVNVEGTLAVLDAARRADARVVFASSAAIYGDPETVPVPESAPQRPASPYGVSKSAADRYVRLYEELYGLPTVSLRYFNAYGPGASAGVVRAFQERVRRGEPLIVEGDGGQTRDFVHVRDVVRANLQAATTDAVGAAFNVGTGERVTIEALAERVQAANGVDRPVEFVEARDGDVRHSCADVSAAREALGFEAQIELDEGLRRLAGAERPAAESRQD
ncbi:hypothetical protein HARCEL1_11895 [Halococcoides cellulosivorans]|uniref:NAD-dependent epimerase/dehydratase domain-containing protein n=1 Tax=Halococcoides cellulosivorans TaxID=1679096 RepID=A0A2R4X4J9_9EURY|nr:NAD-dependent epimerase/dehydratase family protein [Halococcoides cellulosivorans]AWB28722.1 hypothetical protein HARCEL1_11895 [Halococcoides cellulosivorans]